MSGFVAATLTATCRTDVVDKTLHSKLRGKKLLLENAQRTVASGEDRPAKKRAARRDAERRRQEGRVACVPRAARRSNLLAAAAEVTYEQLQRQHDLWRTYAREALGAAEDADELAQLVTRLDWHGAQLRVVRSASAAHAHAEGLVLAETQRMLLLLSSAARRVWVPKRGTVVELVLPAGLRQSRVPSSLQCDAGVHHAS